MGRVATFAEFPDSVTPITMGETKRLAAAHLRLAPGEGVSDAVPTGSDGYLFVLEGAAMLEAGGASHPIARHAFAALPEGTEYRVHNSGTTTLSAVRITAPPPGSGAALPGFAGPVTVTNRADVIPFDIPDQKKQRIYFVAPKAAVVSDRAHAMIVIYQRDTVTDLHHHPDAESMFVLLEGRITFVINGSEIEVGPGQAAYFTVNDRHSLRVTDGYAGAAFLEFHLPAAFTTVKETHAA